MHKSTFKVQGTTAGQKVLPDHGKPFFGIAHEPGVGQPKRKFDVLVRNEFGSVDLVLKVQFRVNPATAWTDGGSVTVKPHCTKTWTFTVKGRNDEWRIFATGDAFGEVEFIDIGDTDDGAMVQ